MQKKNSEKSFKGVKKLINKKTKIEVDSVYVNFKTEDGGQVNALDNINLKVEENEFFCIMGPSGCGKTTLLNVIAGLLNPTSGQVKLDGEIIKQPGSDRAVIFQNDAVFPWMCVEDNIAFSLKCKGLGKNAIKKTVDHYIDLVNLNDFRRAWPRQLSGGMKKRVDIARAYAANPEVFLMDEPFGSLDYVTKVDLQKELLKIWQKERKTTLFVTHDLEEALFLSDRIFVFDKNNTIAEIIEVPFSRPRGEEVRNSQELLEQKKLLWRYFQ